MKIDLIETIPYSLAISKPFVTSKNTFNKREGYIIKILSDGVIGYGDVCPLPCFNSESVKDTIYGLELFKNAIKNIDDISKAEFIDMMAVYLIDLPSAQFGLNSAFIDLNSKINGISFAKYLNKNNSKSVFSNGLDSCHTPKNQYPIIKVKVGFRNLFDEIKYLDHLTDKYGSKTKFRLDVNEKFDLPMAIRFCKEVEKYNIDYIEQPLNRNSYEDLNELSYHTKLKIAVDESITDIFSLEKIIKNQCADVIIIKPMVTGSIAQIKDMINLAKENSILSIITSSLESNIGRTACIHLASAFNISKPCGLATNSIFNNNLGSELIINKGEIIIPDSPGLGIEINVN